MTSPLLSRRAPAAGLPRTCEDADPGGHPEPRRCQSWQTLVSRDGDAERSPVHRWMLAAHSPIQVPVVRRDGQTDTADLRVVPSSVGRHLRSSRQGMFAFVELFYAKPVTWACYPDDEQIIDVLARMWGVDTYHQFTDTIDPRVRAALGTLIAHGGPAAALQLAYGDVHDIVDTTERYWPRVVDTMTAVATAVEAACA